MSSGADTREGDAHGGVGEERRAGEHHLPFISPGVVSLQILH